MFTSVEIFTMKDRSTVDKQSELLKLLSQFDQSLNELEERIELHNVIDQRQRRAFNNHFDQFMKTVKRHDKVVTQHSIPQFFNYTRTILYLSWVLTPHRFDNILNYCGIV